MKTPYFSDREVGSQPRLKEELHKSAWGGIIAIIQSRIADGSFGYRYPLECSDGLGIYGCDEHLFSLAIKAEVPEIEWPLNPDEVPPTLAVLDLIEFCYRAVGKPMEAGFHRFFGHRHIRFEPKEGSSAFREDIDRVLARNGLAYTLSHDGLIVRLAPKVLREALVSLIFQTGDPKLDMLLEDARRKFSSPDSKVRQESLEKLQDAWERLKTLEVPSKDKKKKSTKLLLDRAASEPKFRDILEKEARELTNIGNTFEIRHSETHQVSLELNEHVDYLFHRMFALLRLILRTTGRDG